MSRDDNSHFKVSNNNEKFFIGNINYNTNIIFNDNENNEIGKFFVKNGKLCFTGSTDPSAKRFVEFLKDSFDNKLSDFLLDKIYKYFKNNDFKLCLVLENTAYFTNEKLSKQWGDGWDDIHYEHNAGEPYEEYNNQIIKLKFESDFKSIADRTTNSNLSVKMINDGYCYWLRNNLVDFDDNTIYAGERIDSFINKIKKYEGDVYINFDFLKKI